MSDYLDFLKKARKNLHVADYMLTQTYPLVKYTKLLLAVMENLFLALSNTMDSLLYFERERKSIPPFHNSFDSRFNTFKLKLVGKHNLNKDHLNLIQDIKALISSHKNSPVEFVRQDKFVICSEEYDMKSISVEQMRSFIQRSRSFLEDVNKIMGAS